MKQPKVISGRQSYLYAQIGCEKPIFVETMSGKRIPVPCGHCPACLSRRRQMWSKRLVDESQDERCIHAFGFTLTYDSKHVPFLPKKKLEYIKQNQYDFDKIKKFYEFPNKSHSYLKKHRGCRPSRLATTEYVGILASEDIDQFLKKVRNELNEKINHIKSHQKGAKADLFIRYFIHGDYGEIDDDKGETGRTGRPHYHGIMFLCCRDAELSAEIKQCMSLLNNLQCSIENIVLNSWTHCKRFWSMKKQRWCGKSIETFGKNWGDYLGRYITKEENGAFCGCEGEKYVPARIWCSRCNPKYDYGCIGSSFLSNLLYAQYMADLKRCQETGELFNPSFKENGYTKALPRAYVGVLQQKFFGFKFSRLAKYIRQCNLIEKFPTAWRSHYVETEELDPNDPFGLLHKKDMRLFFHGIIIRKQNRNRFSIQTFPPDREEEYKQVNFDYEEIDAFERYLAFHTHQVDEYIDKMTDGILDLPKYRTKVVDHNLQALLGKADSEETDPLFLREVRKLRHQQLAYCADIRKKALDRKHAHEIKNGYTAC